MLKEYPEYKEVKAFGISKIPSTWTLRHGFTLFEENKSINKDGKQKLLLQFNYGEIVPKQLQDAETDDKGTYLKYSVIKPGYIVINGLNLNYDFVSQRVAASNLEGAITSAYLTFKVRDKNNIAYIKYLLKGFDGIKMFHSLGSGLRQTLTSKEVLQMNLPYPPLEDQEQIVKYLDCKTKKIDEYISVKEKEINALFELKKSNIIKAVTKGISKSKLEETELYWYPMKPINWKLERAKYIFKKENRIVKPEYETVTCFRDGEVTLRKNRRTTGFTESLQENGYQGVMPGDLVIHVMDAFAGSIGVSDSEGKSTPVYNICNPKIEGINNHYYAYFLRFMAWSGYIVSLSKGIRERSTEFRFEIFGNQFLPIPPIDEQNAIVAYIDKTTLEIEKQIDSIKKEITLLKDLRTKTISDVVTGKIDVRNETIPA